MPRKAEDGVARFTIKGQPYEIDGAKLTLDEVAAIEEHFDADYDDLYQGQQTLAIIYTAMRRTDPKVTWQTVGALTGEDIDDVSNPKRPTKAVPATAGTPAS